MVLTDKFYAMYKKGITFELVFEVTKNNILNYPKQEGIDALNDLRGQVSCELTFGLLTDEVRTKYELLTKRIDDKIEEIKCKYSLRFK